MRTATGRLVGLRTCTAQQARVIRWAAESDRAVLPRRHPGYRGVHYLAPEGSYSRVPAWKSRAHWLNLVVPLALSSRPEVLRRHRVNPDTFRFWARTESLYAQDQATGRRVVVRPDVVAAVAEMSERHVQRCRAAARDLELLVDVVPGRMLTETECYTARRNGSPQRGLSTESAFAVPAWLGGKAWSQPCFGGHVTPTSGTPRSPLQVTVPTTSALNRSAKTKVAAPPPQHLQGRSPRKRGRRPSPACAYGLARALQALVPWLRHEQPGRLAPALTRFANASPAWTARDIVDAIDQVNQRHGWTSLTSQHVKTRPAAVLAYYLRDLDVHADHPRADLRAFQAARPDWCGTCDHHTRLLELDDGRLQRCPACHTSARRHTGAESLVARDTAPHH
jgi:hypothetical protein